MKLLIPRLPASSNKFEQFQILVYSRFKGESSLPRLMGNFDEFFQRWQSQNSAVRDRSLERCETCCHANTPTKMRIVTRGWFALINSLPTFENEIQHQNYLIDPHQTSQKHQSSCLIIIIQNQTLVVVRDESLSPAFPLQACEMSRTREREKKKWNELHSGNEMPSYRSKVAIICTIVVSKFQGFRFFFPALFLFFFFPRFSSSFFLFFHISLLLVSF